MISNKGASAAEQENFLYERILGVASTAKTFYPFNVCTEQPIAILQKFVSDLERLGSVDSALTKQSYLVSIAKETCAKCLDPNVTPDHKVELLFMVYLHACLASHALQDRYGVESKYWSKYPSRCDAVVLGWTLGWGHEADGQAETIKDKIIAYYAERGISVCKDQTCG
jgi:hypothetical protein